MALVDESRDIFLFKNKFLDLSSKDRAKVFKIDNNSFCKVNGYIYHYKIRPLRYIVNELLGELVSEYFELDTVKSIFARHANFKEKYMLLTKLFEMKKFCYAKFEENVFPNIKSDFSVGLDNLKKLDKIFYKGKIRKYDIEILKLNLKKMIIRDFITNQTDRHNENFLFKINKTTIQLLPLFDYEHSFFCDEYDRFQGLFDLDLDIKKVRRIIIHDNEFQTLLYKAMDLNMLNIIEKLESEYPILLDSDEINQYNDVIIKRQNDIKEYKLIK